MRACRAAHLGLLACVALIGASCHDKTTAPATSASARRAPDQLAPDELLEGRDDAFGFPIPQKLRITRRERDFVVAEGSLAPELVSNYVRARVTGGSVEVGPSKTLFQNVVVTEPKQPFKGTLTMDINGSEKYTSLQIYGHPFIDIPRGRVPKPRAVDSSAP